jgi:hypothetical protein
MSHKPHFHILPLKVMATNAVEYMTSNAMYIADSTSTVNLILPHPANSITGCVIQVCGFGSGLWQVAQAAAGQTIALGNQTSSSAGGYITSTNAGDCVTLTCVGWYGYAWEISGYTGTINFF